MVRATASPPAAPPQAEDVIPSRSADAAVRFGIEEYLRYSRLIDAVAGEFHVPVLHVVQPFRHSNPAIPMPRIDDLPPGALEALGEPHLGVFYARLRARIAAHYASPGARPGVGYLDLAESLEPTDQYWHDYIHTSAQAADIIVNKMMNQLWATGALALATPERRPR